MAPVVVLLVTFRRFICNFELTLVVSRFRLRARFLSPFATGGNCSSCSYETNYSPFGTDACDF